MDVIRNQVDLARRWRPALLSFFLRRVRDHAEAEDLTQELIAKLLGHGGTNVAAPEAYVFQMASNLLADRARRQKVRARYREIIGFSDDPGIDPIDPFRIVAGRAELSRLAFTLTQLPERTRAIFILFRLENMAQEDIAGAFGISVSAVKKHVARAMAALMNELGNAR